MDWKREVKYRKANKPTIIIVADTTKRGKVMAPIVRSLVPTARVVVTSDRSADSVRGVSADRIIDVRSKRTTRSDYADKTISLCAMMGRLP